MARSKRRKKTGRGRRPKQLSPRTLERRRRRDARRDLRDAKHGAGYALFYTGLDFGTVRQFLFVSEADPSRWRYKRRRSVLGLWRQMKEQLWQQHLEQRAFEASLPKEPPF